MTLQQIVLLAFAVSLLLIVFGFGLEASVQDVVYLLERPGLFTRSVVAMFVIVPVVAVLLVNALHLPQVVEAALLALAISPVPPILPRKLRKAGARSGFGLSLTVTMSLVSIVVAAVALPVLGQVFGRPMVTPLSAIVSSVLKFIVAPLALGMIVRHFRPELANTLEKPVSLVGSVLLIVAALVVLVGSVSEMWALVGNGTLAALTVFVVAGLAAGHLMAPSQPGHQRTLAIASASRHPGIAVAVASANFPMEHFGAIILLYLLMSGVLCAPYIKWRQAVAG